MALMKSKLVFKDSNFQNELEKVIQKFKLQTINSKNLIQEINEMRRIVIKPETKKKNEKQSNLNISENVENKIHWYETKYSLGGQRDI